MQIKHGFALTGAALGAAGTLASPAAANTLDVSLTLPRMSVAEYHRPYVALWLEKEGAPAKTLTILYDVDKRNNAGAKWLRDVRLWWRASGRSLKLPADGVSGATRAPGTHALSFTTPLAPGKYTLVVEAAREVGGREVVRVPFTLSSSGTATASGTGSSELGALKLNVRK